MEELKRKNSVWKGDVSYYIMLPLQMLTSEVGSISATGWQNEPDNILNFLTKRRQLFFDKASKPFRKMSL